MRLLVDNCLSRRFAERIGEAGHDVIWAGDWGADPGDAAIMARAYEERRVVVTRDQDFATLALAYGHKHAGLLRIVDTPATKGVEVCLRALTTHGTDLERGAIVVAFLQDTRVHQE